MSTPVKTEWITLAPGFAGYLALPPAGSGPGLVLWQEIFGVNAHIRALAEQYALDGFVVLAPDAFWRQAPQVELGYGGPDFARAIELMKAYSGPDALSDIAHSVAALRNRPEVAGRKVGSFGYCMGGRLAYLAAATAGVDAAVAYYGGGIQGQLDRAASITCPVQFHYAEQDDNIPLAAVEQVRGAMAGKGAEVHVYRGAHHGFNCWARGSYDAPSAALAHGRSLQFLAQHLFA
jgi:carboxymethylenebutenolidase